MQFNMYKGKLLVDEESIPKTGPLRKIYLMKDGLKILLYIFFRCDLSKDNPLKDISYDAKDTEARLAVFHDKYFNFGKNYTIAVSNTIDAGINYYMDNIVTEAQKDIHAYNRKMDQLREMLTAIEPSIQRNINDNNEAVSFTTNIDIINNTLRDIVNIIQSKSSLTTMYVQGTIPKQLRGRLSEKVLTKLKIDDKL